MIEVKVDAELHTMEIDRATLRQQSACRCRTGTPRSSRSSQHDAYRLAWSRVEAATDAKRRFVGVLSLESAAPSAAPDEVAGVGRARNVTWRDLHARFTELVESVDADVRLVLEDFSLS